MKMTTRQEKETATQDEKKERKINKKLNYLLSMIAIALAVLIIMYPEFLRYVIAIFLILWALVNIILTSTR